MKKRSRHMLAITALITFATLATGCSRGVCEPWLEDQEMHPVSDSWKEKADLVPPTATACGNVSPAPSPLWVDFADGDDNPWVTMVDHLEGQGWSRVSQHIDDPRSQAATLTKGDQGLDFRTWLEDGRYRATITYRR